MSIARVIGDEMMISQVSRFVFFFFSFLSPSQPSLSHPPLVSPFAKATN